MSLVQPAVVEPGPGGRPRPARAGARLAVLVTVGAVLVSGAAVVRHAVTARAEGVRAPADPVPVAVLQRPAAAGDLLPERVGAQVRHGVEVSSVRRLGSVGGQVWYAAVDRADGVCLLGVQPPGAQPVLSACAAGGGDPAQPLLRTRAVDGTAVALVPDGWSARGAWRLVGGNLAARAG